MFPIGFLQQMAEMTLFREFMIKTNLSADAAKG